MLGEAFDPKGEFLIQEHCRPHWSQAGAVVIITFRTNDSIPREVLERWDREKTEWLNRRGWSTAGHWSSILQTLPEEARVEFDDTFERCREEALDSCHGRCLLKRPEISQLVSDSLLRFDFEHYRMGDFVIMPNHVHLLAVFPGLQAMREQCDSWLHYTAFRINRATSQKGKFWQEEPFDHLVRSAEQYKYLRHYIATNPQKARLKPGEYLYRRYEG